MLGSEKVCAIIVHLYYVEMWDEILSKIQNIPFSLDIFITAPNQNKAAIDALDTKGATIFYFENRGRDVRPFLKILQAGALDSYELVCKVHTKKSPHLIDGNEWRERLFDGLLGNFSTVEKFSTISKSHEDLGILVSPGSLLDIRQATMSNEAWLERLSSDFSINWKAYHYFFPVGTMFWFRPQALKSAAALADYPFEDEAGQVDGCLHHAIERFLPLLAIKDGYRTAAIDDPEASNPTPVWNHNTKIYQNWLIQNISASQYLPEENVNPRTETVNLTIIVNAIFAASKDIETTLDSLLQNKTDTVSLILLSDRPAPDRFAGQTVFIQSERFAEDTMAMARQRAPDGWLCFLRAGDSIRDGVLPWLTRYLASSDRLGLVYCDEDVLDSELGPSDPLFKPEFDIDYLRSTSYIGRFPIFRNRECTDLGGAVDANGDFLDYVLRFYERYGAASIGHIPEVVFHGTPVVDSETAQTAHKEAVRRHLARCGIAAEVAGGLLPGARRINYHHARQPLVSIIIPTKNQAGLLSRCMESLTERTSYPHYEVLIVDNGSDEPEAVAYLRGLEGLGLEQIRVYSYPHPFNFAAMNNLAVREARGEYVLLLNNDTAIIQADWLEALLNHGQRPEVGAVGAKLLYPDGKVQHAGVVLGLRGPADHPFLHEAMNAPGYAGRLLLDQRYCAVTAACMLVRKSVYEEVGGMDETDFKVSYNDVDLCLKIRQSGHEVIWTPHAKVMHVGSVSQKAEDSARQEAKRQRFESEKQAMYRKWMPLLANDPAYNRNLSLSGNGFELESSPLFQHPQEGQAKIYALCADNFGSGLYRTIAPTSALMEAGHAVGGCGRAYLDTVNAVKADPSTIIFQRQITETQIGYIQDYRNYTRAKLIFELDDYLPNLPVASLHKSATPKDVMRNMRRAMDLCDRVVVSTEALKHALDKFHRDIVVLPNYLPVSMWDKQPPRPVFQASHKPRVGWAGGIGHTGDLRLITDIVRTLSDRVDWVFFGMQPEGVSGHVAEFYPGVSVADYPESLARLNLDLALAPLEDNRFNECKSNLRLLEYGICGYPVIASDALPYRCGLPVTLVKNRFKDWLEAIESKLADIEALQQEGLALQAVIRKDWMLSGNNLMRWRDGWMLSAR